MVTDQIVPIHSGCTTAQMQKMRLEKTEANKTEHTNVPKNNDVRDFPASLQSDGNFIVYNSSDARSGTANARHRRQPA
jgi:hypothetical protein